MRDFMIKRLLKMDDCRFYFPDRRGNYHLVEIKNSAMYCGGHWKEVKLYDDGSTDLIDVCEMLANICVDSDPADSDCDGCGCVYFDASRINADTGRIGAYCKKQKCFLKVDYENRRVYAGQQCSPVPRVTNR